MIERTLAESGDPVVRVAGRLLASRVDPRAEARAWADPRAMFLRSVKTVIVLGLGAGYHVAELLERTAAAILVVEPNAELAASPVLALDPDRVTIESLRTAGEVRGSEAVRRAVAESYVVLTHPASRALDPDAYREISLQLNGRDWGSLGWIWALRGNGELVDEARPASDQPLSIYDLAQNEVVNDATERKSLLIKALRELVK